MGFLAPTGILLPSLALSNVSYKAWWRFIRPFLIFHNKLGIANSLFESHYAGRPGTNRAAYNNLVQRDGPWRPQQETPDPGRVLIP